MVTRISRMFTVMVAAAMMFAASANAAPLGLVSTLPDIDSTNVLSSFSGDHLSTDFAQTNGLHLDGPANWVFITTLSLDADIDDSGTLQPGGTLVLDPILFEDYSDLGGGANSHLGEHALSVNLTEFGFDGSGVLEFRGLVSSVNSIISSLFPVGATVGIIFYTGTGTGVTDWSTAGWSSTQVRNATLDVFVIPAEVPTPAAAGSIVALMGLGLVRRRRQA